MAKRNGVFSLSKAARQMCRLITFFEPILRKQFPANTALMAALAAASAACGVLEAQLELVEVVGD